MEQYLSISATILTSLGGGGFIVYLLSNKLGEVWARRLMDKERHDHNEALEKLRSDLKTKNDEQIATISHNYEIFKQTHLREHNDKLEIYRTTLDIAATTLAKIEMILMNRRKALSSEELETFEIARLRVYGYLAMLAPQDVMDANDNLTNILIDLVHHNKATTWETIRDSALILTNAMRKDIGLNKDKVTYNGEL